MKVGKVIEVKMKSNKQKKTRKQSMVISWV